MERTTQRIFQDVRSLEAEMLRMLSEQTSTEKSSAKTAADIRALRTQAVSEEMLIAGVQNELARLAVDALNTQGHNERLRQALKLLDDELTEKVGPLFCPRIDRLALSPAFKVPSSHICATCKWTTTITLDRAYWRVLCVCLLQDAAIAKSEVELKRRTDEIERKTRETDNLNRKLERLLAAQPGTLHPCS